MAERRVYEISWVGLWRVLFFLALIGIIVAGRRVLLGLFLAVIISSGLEFMVDFLEKRGLPRTLGVILIFLFAAFLVVVALYTVVPLILVDLNTALTQLNKLASSAWWGPIVKPLVSFESTRSLGAFVNRISSQFLAGNVSPLGAISDVVGSMALAISVLISAFYLSLRREGVEDFIRAVIPADYEEPALRVYTRSRRRIGQWFRAQIVLSVVIGVSVIIALSILGVKYAFLLGLLAGIFELVPFVGPILSGAAAVIAALVTSPVLALWTLVIFVVLHQIESHILVPLIVGRSVGLHPVIVIVALLMGIELGGVFGMLISVPAAVVSQEVLEGWSGKGPQEAAG